MKVDEKAKNSTEVSICQIHADAKPEVIQELREFCGTLTEYDENGFQWPQALMDAKTEEEFCAALAEKDAKEKLNLESLQRGYVPQELWWIRDPKGKIIGLLKLRYLLTPAMLRTGGHVGIGLAKPYRGQGYGAKALALAVQKCHEHGLKDILLTAHDDNWASRMAIRRNGGYLWDTIVRDDGSVITRHWIAKE